ncbi:MAG TPA: hypothetical protein VLC98_03015 [Phnomibacter sp.]|nr:hypothetical protein [Phnomibacter sp.]
MRMRFNNWWLVVVVCVLFACKGTDKKSMKGDVDVTIKDFVAFFDDIKLPFAFNDTLLSKKLNDSSLIEYKVFKQFLSDTIFKAEYKKEKPKIYALGKFKNSDAETYLAIKTKGSQNAIYLVALDEKLVPKASMLLLSNKGKSTEINQVSIDKRFIITLTDEYKMPNGDLAQYATVYAYNNVGVFMVIMNDGLKKGEVAEFVNPIDTFPQTRPHTGDYGRNKQNFISFRDADTEKKLLFFLNMNKSTKCKGELKGEARWVNKDSAICESSVDGCRVGFRFKGKNVTVTEIDGCLGRRPADCSFNGTFAKMAPPKSKKKSSK